MLVLKGAIRAKIMSSNEALILRLMKHLLALYFIVISPVCLAYQNFELELDSGTVMNMTHFQGAGKSLLLWLPSERGFGKGHIPVALNLAAVDLDSWVTHLHESYIIPTGRRSLNEIEIPDLVNLIDIARNKGFQEVFIISSSRGAQLALKMAYMWQQDSASTDFIKGLVLFSPHLIRGKTEIGELAEYIEIARFSNLPVYMLQAQYSTKYARSREIAQQLQLGGSPTYVHLLSGVQGGFHMRPDEDLTDVDLHMRAQLAQILENATTLLRQTGPAPFDNRYPLQQVQSRSVEIALREPRLHVFKGNKAAPALFLNDINGDTFKLADSSGKVVLVNFWATWCGPCVEEIPSLSRLVEGMKDKPFKVVAVNIGESQQAINEFIKAIPVNFDILLDKDGQTVRDWKVYAYPSNFLVDQQGQIQYAYRGALKWDAPSIVKTIERLF